MQNGLNWPPSATMQDGQPCNDNVEWTGGGDLTHGGDYTTSSDQCYQVREGRAAMHQFTPRPAPHSCRWK